MKILVTSGATREPIDDVRFLSNVSTGTTGAALATALAAASHGVTLLHGAAAPAASGAQHNEEFSSAMDLSARLRRQLATGDFDAIIMTAAVADYRPAAPFVGKLPSTAETLTLELVRNPKILPHLKSLTTRPLRVIGFKLTAGADADHRRAAVSAQFAAGGVDAVVHNDLYEIRAAAREQHPFALHCGLEVEPLFLHGVPALANALSAWLAEWPARPARELGSGTPARV
ncbi:phosphopantothenoylcysteine decarboxylase [Opitutus terrae]|uniref:DNA/pantothenate metabolism flavoprotein domain protein n=1 Tax=Opitutus terrae (strain DSM 11246 / JCM 15787 / PB90-1) TaxID=452637 RepID=B1ZVH4_OPITP|nr:phosphopantothenoylcysteine decarboxylase [Opitutus terrae]ACB74071.1 DNA/pantothenate metabolism flavoprotein domain protein [Opitutus terrae PB90-1]